MKKKYLLLGFFLTAALMTVNVKQVNSKKQSPPAGSAGDPVFTTTCAQGGCHAGPVQNSTTSDLTLKIGTNSPNIDLDNSFVYTPGVTYNIAFSILATATTNPFYGFQMVALTSSNAQAGDMTAVGSNNQVNTLSGLEYIGHKNASSIRNWSFKWQAPATTGSVTFYYTFNVVNASTANPTTPQGTIYKGSVTIEGLMSGVEDISTKVSDLNIFPNPISNELRISFVLKQTENVSAQLYTLDGRLVKELINEKMSEGNFNQAFDANDLSSGIYLVKLTAGQASVTRKIVKQ